MTLFSEKALISNRCISGLMPNLIKKSWTVSNVTLFIMHNYCTVCNVCIAISYFILGLQLPSRKKSQINQSNRVNHSNVSLDQKQYEIHKISRISSHRKLIGNIFLKPNKIIIGAVAFVYNNCFLNVGKYQKIFSFSLKIWWISCTFWN